MPGRPYAGWAVALVLTLLIAAIASSPPLLAGTAREVVMRLFSSVCHQLPTRSPHINGVQLAVCHRCIGTYWALPLAAVLYRVARGRWPFGRFAPLVLLISAMPAGVDWFGDIAGWWSNTPSSRVITGAMFGLVAGYYFTRAVGDIVRNTRRRKSVDYTDPSNREIAANQDDRPSTGHATGNN